MKIVAVIGSQRHEESYTYNLTKKLIEKFETRYVTEVESTIFECNEIKMCKGCLNCFLNGSCIINDNMEELENKLLEADLIILATPVFVHNVSGIMKNFIDRIAYWTHIFKLSGKLGITISVSASNGNKEVTQYLKKVNNHLGINTIASLEILETSYEPTIFDEEIEKIVNKINGISTVDDLIFDYYQEMAFQSFKKLFNAYGSDALQLNESEYNYWLQNGMQNFRSYSDMFKTYCKIF